MSVMIIISAAMLFIMWYAQDRSGRRQIMHPTFTGGYPMSGKPNPYMGKMSLIGVILAVPMGLLAWLLVWLASVIP